MISSEDTAFVAQLPIFAALPAASMVRLAALAQRVDVAEAGVVFGEGEPAKEMVVVLKGELEVLKRARSGAHARIAVLRQGDVAGEMAMIDIQPRSARVSALGPASLVVLTHANLATFYREDPESYTVFVLNVAREISRRLRRVDRLLADILVGVEELWAGGVAAAGGPARGDS